MSEPLSLLLACLLGVRHALEPAHLAAVSALVSLGGSRARSLALTGAYAIAHGAAVAALGLIALTAGATIGPDALGLLERVGGALLALFGALAIRAVLTGREGHPVGDLAARLGAAGLGGAALFGGLHAIGGEGATQALATAGLASAGGGPVLLLFFVIGLLGANLAGALLLQAGLAIRVAPALRAALLIGYGLLGLGVGLGTLFH